MPSREFMIRQAVLNFTKDAWPNSVSYKGAAWVLKNALLCSWLSDFDFEKVRAEYKQIMTREQLIERGMT